jgi:hypothetical protein
MLAPLMQMSDLVILRHFNPIARNPLVDPTSYFDCKSCHKSISSQAYYFAAGEVLLPVINDQKIQIEPLRWLYTDLSPGWYRPNRTYVTSLFQVVAAMITSRLQESLGRIQAYVCPFRGLDVREGRNM